MGPGKPENGSIADRQHGSSSKNVGHEVLRSDHCPGRIIRGFLKRAVLWSLVFGLVHVLGFRAYTSLLSGTASFGIWQRLFGTTYLVLYVGFVILVPVLLIASGLLKAVASTSGLWMRANKHGGSSDNGMLPTP